MTYMPHSVLTVGQHQALYQDYFHGTDRVPVLAARYGFSLYGMRSWARRNKPTLLPDLNCKQCGQTFPWSRLKVYCSIQCQQRYLSKRYRQHKPRNTRLSLIEKREVIRRRKLGESWRNIARAMCAPVSTVRRATTKDVK